MEYQLTRHNDIQLVTILADKIVHANADGFKTAMIDLIHKGGNRILMDLSKVGFIDSRGLGVLISLFKSLGPGGMLSLCVVNDSVCKVFEVTKLDRVFSIHPDVESGLEAMRAQ
ncbi:anti-sigma B factor antagonist [Desulfonatronum zhilinae]|nr:anti-sigma B factor antagonist [Desulfonatronum zhilinae]